jgi:hypothetical protein
MHVRNRAGTRIEETARTVDLIEQMIRQIIPANQCKWSWIIWAFPTAVSTRRTILPAR